MIGNVDVEFDMLAYISCVMLVESLQNTHSLLCYAS